jgi:hypothetical protein
MELYDVRRDPFETNNLAAKPEFASLIKTFQKVLSNWEKETRDVSVKDHLKKDKADRFTGEAMN